jgi:predicted ArsR family transcriptional regulator
MTHEDQTAGDDLLGDLKNPDRLNPLGVLTRREIEARILGPLLDAMSNEFGQERVLEIARDVIIQIARQQGQQMAESRGGRSIAHFAGSLEDWKKDDALELELLEQSKTSFSFNVTRCRYADLYRTLGMPELGAVLSCNRDFSLIEGFNPEIHLTRTQTIMAGAAFCDFRYHLAGG